MKAEQAGVLFEIAARVRTAMEARRSVTPLERLTERLGETRAPGNFAAPFALARSQTERGPARVIAEVKLASPSAGAIAAGADPVAVAGAYLEAGATAISVLTEESAFGGSPAHLRAIRAAFPRALLLKKDFVVDEYQLLEARHEGADAVLLIMALLGPERLARLMARARELGLASLVEVHDEEELSQAGDVGAPLIGVNNRDLKTLRISLDVSRRLASFAPKEAVMISESGITEHWELTELSQLGFSGFLVGSALMREGLPGEALRRLIQGGSL